MDKTNSFVSLKGSAQYPEELGSFKIIHQEPASDNQSTNANNKKITSEYKIVYYEARQTNRHKSPSGVWKYFALASKESSTSANPDDPPDDRILCMLCYGKGRVHVYKSKTSSSNLWKHLNRKHNIEIPTEKMFTISPTKLDGFELAADTESHEANSTDDQLSAMDMDDNDEYVIKDNEYDDGDDYPEEQIIATSFEEEKQDSETVMKYELESCGTDAVFKDIGSAIIEEVSKRPILYERQSGRWHSKRATKEIAWAEVFEALGEVIQIDRIQKIWRNIRDRYRRIRATEKEDGDINSRKYKYYDQLMFLDAAAIIDHSSDISEDEPPEKKPRPEDFSFLIEQTDVMLSTSDERDLSELNYIAEEIANDNSCAVSSSNPPIINTIYPLEIAHNNVEDPPPKQSSSTTPIPSNSSEQMDEFDLFGKLIAKKLRSAPKDRVDLIEIKIMQAILENS